MPDRTGTATLVSGAGGTARRFADAGIAVAVRTTTEPEHDMLDLTGTATLASRASIAQQFTEARNTVAGHHHDQAGAPHA